MKSTERLRPRSRRARLIRPIPLRPAYEAHESRVATAQARIAADYYDRSEVRNRLVEALLREIEGR